MKLPRLSMRAVMVLVGVAALDCVTMREVLFPGEIATFEPTLVVLGSLPMANALALGLVMLRRSRGRSRGFWMGFEIFGSLAVLACLGFVIGWRDDALSRLDWWIRSVMALLHEPDDKSNEIVELGLGFLIFSITQILIALAGGALFASCSRKFPERSGSAQDSVGRLPIGWLVVVCLIVAIPLFTNAGLHRWDIDPRIGRISPGTIVEIVTEGGMPIHHGEPDDFETVVPPGSKVEVRSDPNPSEYMGHCTEVGGPFFWVDDRLVTIKLLEGPYAGRVAEVRRRHLRPR